MTKRIFDFFVSLTVIIILLIPLIIITLLLLLLNRGASPFFIQTRTGKNAKLFKLVKFKTMTDTRDANGKLLPDEQRLTPVGRLLRSTSFDEISQLIHSCPK
jgi:lipopolysaccharide/colanic/teichoic acid biosynthesis glycosyltransferase